MLKRRAHLVVGLCCALVLLALPAAASAAPQCTGQGSAYVSCTGYTDTQYVPSHYVNTPTGMVWVDGYQTTPQFVAYACSYSAQAWQCTSSMPYFSQWTVPAN